jgi:hypothetical protein
MMALPAAGPSVHTRTGIKRGLCAEPSRGGYPLLSLTLLSEPELNGLKELQDSFLLNQLIRLQIKIQKI